MSTPQSKAIVSSKDKQKTIMDMLEKAKPSLAAVLPKHLTPERLLKVALSATARTPALLACTPQSILLATMQAAELGLEVGGLLGDAYFVPYKSVVTLIVGYRGLIKLARQSGVISNLGAHVVNANDMFEIEFGLNERLVHKPCMVGDPGEAIAAYAISRFKDGSHQSDVMTRAEVDRIRDRSQAAKDGPWVTDYDEMAKKTVVRRLCKYLPLSPELAKALEHESAVEQGLPSPVIDMEIFQTSMDEPETRADAIKRELASKGATHVITADGEIIDQPVETKAAAAT